VKYFALLLALLLPQAAAAQTSPCVSANYPKCGLDYSANPAAIPISGYVLIATIPAFARHEVEIQNQSTDLIQIILDDGNGNNQTSFVLTAASATGNQGGSWSDTVFLGRISIYAPSSSDQVAADQR